MTRRPRWLIVVEREQRELYELLRTSLRPDAPFDVVLDRRQGDAPGDAPERKEDRRRGNGAERAPAGLLFLRVALAGPVGATTLTRPCPDCGLVPVFEMPRFPQPPARLEAEVVHAGPARDQHYADIYAFTVSGRSLLVQRVRADASAY
jgi:hypothetical protein